MSKIYIVTGDKGGVGKSVISALITDYLIRNNYENITICDCDMIVKNSENKKDEGQSSFTKFVQNSRNFITDSQFFDLTNDSGFLKMFEYFIKDNINRNVIIDTGANMYNFMKSNDKYFNEVSKAFTENQINLICVVGPMQASTDIIFDIVERFGSMEKIKIKFVFNAGSDNTIEERKDFDFIKNKNKNIVALKIEISEKKMPVIFYPTIPQVVRDLGIDFNSKNVFLPNYILANDENRLHHIYLCPWLADNDKKIQKLL